jgi:TatD DNase family protein
MSSAAAPSSVPLFDTHCHLHDEKLRLGAEDLLSNAWKAGVAGACVICADPENLAAFPKFPRGLKKPDPQFQLAYTIGLHPHEARYFTPELEAHIRTHAAAANAVGETGLDFHYNLSDPEIQKRVFDFQIELACELKKPLVIHCRDARKEVLEMLDRASVKAHPNPGILHCYTEDLETAKKLLALNFTISFSGILAFKNAQDLREVAKMVPLDRILIETDSPYLAPPPHRGKLNEPAWVQRVFDTLSEIRSETPEVIRENLWQNSLKIYGLK